MEGPGSRPGAFRCGCVLPAAAGATPVPTATATSTETAATTGASPGPGAGSGRIEANDVLGRRTLLALDHIELDSFSLVQGLEAAALDGAMVNEYVSAPLPCDEAEPLVRIEPLDRPAFLCHVHPRDDVLGDRWVRQT